MNTSIERNPKFYNNDSKPDTDSRGVELNYQGNTVILNLMFDHTRMQYTAPSGNTSSVSIGTIKNAEERSLHTLVLNNASNSSAKIFNFGPSFEFLDGGGNIITVNPYKTAVFFGAVILGKLFFRSSIESTN